MDTSADLLSAKTWMSDASVSEVRAPMAMVMAAASALNDPHLPVDMARCAHCVRLR